MKNYRKTLKSFDILDIITENEIQKFTKIKKARKAKQTLRLLTTKTPLVRKTMSAAERNRYRILHNELIDFLAERSISDSSEWKSYFFLNELLNRNGLRQFDNEYDQILKNADTRQTVLQQLLITELKLERIIIESVFDRNGLQRMKNTLDELDRMVDVYRDYIILKTAAFRSFLQPLMKDEQVKPVLISKSADDINLKIYELKNTFFTASKIDEKVNALLEVERLTESSKKLNLRRENTFASANLAMLYMLKMDFEKSEAYMQKSIRLKQYMRHATFQMNMFNYIGLALRSGHYDLAFKLCSQFDKGIKKLPAVTFRWQLMKSVIYIFNGQSSEIKRILPVAPARFNKVDYLYFYIIWIIYFIEQKKMENAEQIAETAERLIHRSRNDDSLIRFIHIIEEFIRLSKEKKEKQLKKIILDMIPENLNMQRDNILPLLWLKRKCES